MPSSPEIRILNTPEDREATSSRGNVGLRITSQTGWSTVVGEIATLRQKAYTNYTNAIREIPSSHFGTGVTSSPFIFDPEPRSGISSR
jgi:hypothetical protein